MMMQKKHLKHKDIVVNNIPFGMFLIVKKCKNEQKHIQIYIFLTV